MRNESAQRRRRVLAVAGGFVLATAVLLANSGSTAIDVTPPLITGIAAAPHIIWPPNGQLVPIYLGLTARDDSGLPTTAEIAGVSCNETLQEGDVVFVSSLALQLRADRRNRDEGRVYCITVRCTDAAGNSAHAEVAVTVPANRRG